MKKYAVVHITTVQTITINLEHFEADWGRKPTDAFLTDVAVGHRGTDGDRSGDGSFIRVECGAPLVTAVGKVERFDEEAARPVVKPRRGAGSY